MHNATLFKRIRIVLVLIIILSILIGTIYIINTRRHYHEQIETEAIALAEAALSFFPGEWPADFDNQSIENAQYKKIQSDLLSLRQQNKSVSSAYLLIQKANGYQIIPDMESTHTNAAFDLLDSTTIEHKQIFSDGKPLVVYTAANGSSATTNIFVPIRASDTDQIQAALCVVFSSELLSVEVKKHTAHAAVLVACIMLLLIVLCINTSQTIKLKKLNRELCENETLFRGVFEQAPIGIAVIEDNSSISHMNKKFEDILGRKKEDWSETTWQKVTHPDDVEKDNEMFSRFKEGLINSYSIEKRCLKPDNTIVWVNLVITRLLTDGASTRHLCIIQDIDERKAAEAALRESERSKAVMLANLPGMAYRCNYDPSWTMLFVSEGCFELTGYKAESLVDNRQISYNCLIAPEYRAFVRNEWTRAVKQNNQSQIEYEIITASGVRKWVLEMGQGVYNKEGQVIALEGIIIDISESKERYKQIQYMNDHDFMTGLYNRKYFEEQKHKLDRPEQLPLSIVIADINGVRLINDAFGHLEGDNIIKETAGIIQSCCREQDVLARTGGDEFSILMPNTNRDKAYEMIRAIRSAYDKSNRAKIKNRNISLAIGFGTKQNSEDSIQSAIKEAEEYMHNIKMLERKSYHSAILSSIMATLYAKSQETEEHAERIARFCVMIGKKINLPQKSINELELLAMLHDIGKVGIDDRILNKPGELTKEEWKIMKKHSEIGCRIAQTTPELESISGYILSHHERWDGNGYPQGLKGEEIPLLSRILAIVDAYDAMTEDRVYRKAMSKEKAIEELKRNAGTQFDPGLIGIFIDGISD